MLRPFAGVTRILLGLLGVIAWWGVTAASPLLDLAEPLVVPGEAVDVTILGVPGHHFALAVSGTGAGLTVAGRPLQLGLDAQVIATGRLDGEGRAVIPVEPEFAGSPKLHLQAVTATTPDFERFAVTPGKVLRNAFLWPPPGGASGVATGMARNGAGDRTAAEEPAGGTGGLENRPASPLARITRAVAGPIAPLSEPGSPPECVGCGTASALASAAATAARSGPGAVSAWLLGGNAGTNPASQFVGTTDAQALQFRVAGQRAFRLEPPSGSDADYGAAPSVVGGQAVNVVVAGVSGATIGGGGGPNGECDGVGTSCPNRVTDHFGAVGGGVGNQAGDGDADPSTARFATVGGGSNNTASGDVATIGGGQFNTASGAIATIGGGGVNKATADATTVGGGVRNEANVQSATVGGGSNNTASGSAATVGGGQRNTASGSAATVPGGIGAEASLFGQLAYAAGQFSFAGDAQTSLYVLRRFTSTATANLPLHLDGSTRLLTIRTDCTYAFEAYIVARREDNQTAAYTVRGVIRNNAGTLSFPGGAPTVTTLGTEGAGAATWAVNVFNNPTDDSLDIRVTGDASGSGIRWVAVVRTLEVRG